MGYPPCRPCTPRLQMRRLVSSPKWRTLASHSPAGVLSGRQVLPHTTGCKLTCSTGTPRFLIMLSVSQGPKYFVTEFVVLINIIHSKILSALSQYDFLRLCFGLHTDSPFHTYANIKLFGSWLRSTMINFIDGEFIKF